MTHYILISRKRDYQEFDSMDDVVAFLLGKQLTNWTLFAAKNMYPFGIPNNLSEIISKKSEAKFYTIRLKNHPELYLGKKTPTYGIMTDFEIGRWLEKTPYKSQNKVIMDLVGCWFKSKQYAKVWTKTSTLKAFLTLCHESDGLSQYEIMCNDKPILIKNLSD
jgi:hypothetical protein